MATDAGLIILFAAMFGMLAGIVWSLRYIVLLDKKIEVIDIKIERMIEHLAATKKKKK